MLSQLVVCLGLAASAVLGQQVTLTPSTIKTGRTEAFPTQTVTVTSTATYIREVTATVTKTAPGTTVFNTRTVISVSTATVVSTSTVRSTVTQPCGNPAAPCPTVTTTATACRSCLVPQCTVTEALTRPCGCTGALPTKALSFPCGDSQVCNNIGCTTVYAIQTARC